MAVIGARPATSPWFLGGPRRAAPAKAQPSAGSPRAAESHPARRVDGRPAAARWPSSSPPPSRSSTSASRPGSRRPATRSTTSTSPWPHRRAEQQQLIMAVGAGPVAGRDHRRARDQLGLAAARRLGHHLRHAHRTTQPIDPAHAAERGRRTETDMLARTDSRARAVVLLIVVAVAASAIGARLVWWQVVQQEWLAAIGARPAGPAAAAPGGARRDHRRQRGAARHLDRAAVGLRHPAADRRSGAAARCSRRSSTSRPAELRASLERRPRLGLAEAADLARGRRAHPGARPARHRHAPRDEAGLPDRGHRCRTRPSPPRSSASSTSTAIGQYGVEGGENALLAGTPGAVERAGGRRSAATSPTRPPCCRSRSTEPTCA